jgi:tetratricopeptide (TPR) repeat protein
VALLTQTLAQTIATEMVCFRTLCCLSLGEAQALAGRPEEAHRLAKQALTLARAHQERGNEAYARRLLGDIAAHCDPPQVDEADTHYRQALALADELGVRPLQAHCHHGLGTLYSHTGQVTAARAELAAAIDLYRNMHMTFWLPAAEVALAQMEDQ